MKKILSTLLLLLLATGAQARSLVILEGEPNVVSGTPARNWQVFAGMCLRTLETMGITYDAIPVKEAARYNLLARVDDGTHSPCTYVARSGYYNGIQYDAVIHVGWMPTASGLVTSPTGFNGDSLTRLDKWPTVPNVFLIWPIGNSGFAHTYSGACSTGVTTTLNPASSYTQTDENQVYYIPGNTPIIWKMWGLNGGNQWRALPQWDQATVASNMRCIVGLAHGIVVPAFLTARRYVRPDTVVTTLSEYPDTLVAWARYFNVRPKAPLVWVQSAYNMSLATIAIAHADSFTGGKIIDAARKPKIGVVVTRAFRRGDGTSGGGTICNSSVCDTAYVKSSIDSLYSLGIPITVAYEPDSVNVYPYEKAWWAKLKERVRYAPMCFAGTSAGVNGDGKAYPSRPLDPLGIGRARKLIPDGFTEDSLTNAWAIRRAALRGDTSLFMLNKYVLAMTDSLFGVGKTSRTVMGKDFDWTPTGFGQASNKLDSLASIYYYCGYRNMISNVDDQESAVDKHLAAINTGQIYGTWTGTSSVSNPKGFFVRLGESSLRASKGMGYNPNAVTGAGYSWSSGNVLADLPVIYARSLPTDSSGCYYPSNQHDLALEMLNGRLTSSWWYWSVYSTYYHEFYAPLQVFVVRSDQLGHGHPANNPAPGRHGWWNVKWLANQVNAINHYAGRNVIQFAFTDDITK